ncbi:ribosome recycling factor [candidate division TM6 bacterium RIFCSPHIGHO2_12_FULL_32_22]|nr:MAG: ribosome recycling factor [candidate division TM6 bacterium RIFCSPHIGHO2_12_FULL_32_22]
MINITPNTYSDDFQKAIAPEMQKHIQHFQKELTAIRTGRASSSLVEDLLIECYGSKMKLKEVASIATPEARLIVIQPWDKSILGDVEKGILTSELGLTPVNNGELIRIQLPMMSTERRDELIKLLNKKLEECKAHIRNARKDFQNSVRDAEKKKAISEDFAKSLLDILQKETDKFIAEAEKNSSKKEQDIKG